MNPKCSGLVGLADQSRLAVTRTASLPSLKSETVSEPVCFYSRTYGQRLTALMVIRSLAIWVSTLVMLSLMVAPALFHGKELGSHTLFGALILLVIAQVFQAFTLLAWRKPDLQRVVWDPESLSFVLDGYRLTQKFGSFGSVKFQWPLPLSDIIEVTLNRGYGTSLRLKTKQGFVQISNDLEKFDDLATLMMDLVQNPPQDSA